MTASSDERAGSPATGGRRRVAPFDHTPAEVESPEELDHHLAAGTLAGLTVQGVPLTGVPAARLAEVDVTDTLFVGCRFASPEACADLVRRGATVVPAFSGLPYPTEPGRLYRPEDLAAGFAEHGFAGMYDTIVYRHFLANGGALPPVREALAQRIHDHGIDNALGDTIGEWAEAGGGPVVGIMGGHAVPRGSAPYRQAAMIGHGLARGGCLVVTGGGPGVMEATNLGAFLADADAGVLDAAIDALAVAPDFTDHDRYTRVALRVRGDFGATAAGSAAGGVCGWARQGGLSVPTWLYGHEPANLFAARVAKYFSNAIREDTILRLARGGVVFAAGRAGTVQEIFQAATKAFYATDGATGPFVFLGRAFWSAELPVADLLTPLFTGSPHGDLSHLVRLTDDPAEAVGIILAYRTPATAVQIQHATP